MPRLIMIALTLLLLAGATVAESPQDTATALAEAVVQPRDFVDLARRLKGVTEIAPPPSEAPDWKVGDLQSFWVTNEFEDFTFQVEARLQAAGDHILFWVEDDVRIAPDTLKGLTQIFDDRIYDAMQQLWGSEPNPGIDGDPRVYGLFAYGLGPGLAAYFAAEHTQPVETVSTSNEHEMFFFNLDTLGTEFDADLLAGTVAHEFQHMIQENLDSNESSWLNEGLSSFSELYAGYPLNNASAIISFLSQPETQLNTWPENASRRPYYGGAMLFVTYFYDRFGEAALHELANHPESSLRSVEDLLQSMDEGDVNSLFADWVLANYLQDPDLAEGDYGYRSIPALMSPPPVASLDSLPFTLNQTSNQYATDYLVFEQVPDAESLTIQIDLPETVALVPANPSSGEMMWYSNIADNSDTTLTQRFDLSEVDEATLEFRLWYFIENLWDYGYVMLSEDDGESWIVLETETMTHENPHNTAYGPGYTGSSVAWLTESISLDDYTGQEVLLRFEMITDDATTQPGMLIDDVSIPEIGYSSDFEADMGGWESQGWIWTDNRLPQQAWVQVVQHLGDDVAVTRWQAAADEDTWTLALDPAVEQIILAISPFAPVTTVPVDYRLSIEAE